MNQKIPGFLSLRFSLWWLLAIPGVVVCASTLAGFLGRFAWCLDLFSHFRAQYLIGLSVLGLVLLLGRRRRTGAAFIAFACINLVVVLPLYIGGQVDAPEGARILRAMLLNVNTSLGDPERVKQVIQEADPDILVLEEINTRQDNLR